MAGRLPLLIVPRGVRRWRYDWRARRMLLRERDRLFNAMWDAIDAEPNEERHIKIFEDYNRKIAEPNGRLDELRVRRLEEYAIKHGLQFQWFEVHAPRAAPGTPEWLKRVNARDEFERGVREHRWRRVERVANVITPMLSLLVALAALLISRACSHAIEITIPNP